MAILLAGYERYPQAKNSRPGELESKRLKKPRQSRWVRERKRFDRGALERIEVNVLDLERYLYKTHRDIVDIRRSIDYTNRVIDKQFDYIRGEES